MRKVLTLVVVEQKPFLLRLHTAGAKSLVWTVRSANTPTRWGMANRGDKYHMQKKKHVPNSCICIILSLYNYFIYLVVFRKKVVATLLPK